MSESQLTGSTTSLRRLVTKPDSLQRLRLPLLWFGSDKSHAPLRICPDGSVDLLFPEAHLAPKELPIQAHRHCERQPLIGTRSKFQR